MSDRRVGLNRMGKITPDINPKLNSNPKPRIDRKSYGQNDTKTAIRLVRNCPEAMGRVDRISRSNRVGLSRYLL